MYRLKRYDDCIKELKERLKTSPNSLHLLNYQAMAYSALKMDKEALTCYQKIIRIDTSLAGPYYNMGIILKRLGRIEEAVECYKKAILLKPDYVQAYNNLGIVYKDRKQYEKAIKMFMKAKEIQPDHQNSYYNLALIKKEQGLDEEASEIFLKVLELNPEHTEAKYNAERTCNELGIKFNEKGNYKLALKYFKIFTELQPSSAIGYYNMGNTYLDLKDLKSAETLFKSSLRVEPQFEAAHSNLGVVYRSLGQLKKSISSYKEAIKINPKNPNNYYNKAITFKQAGKIFEAEENYKKALLLDPKHIGSYHNLSLIYEQRGQIKEALSVAKNILKFEPNHPDTKHAIGKFSLQLGLFREGWRNYEYRWKIFPGNKAGFPIQNKPFWKGEKGKTIVIWKEQGIGDQIICLSLIPEVQQMCSSLSVYIDPRLHSLCRRAMPNINIIPDEKSLKVQKCDFHIPIQSIGRLIRNDISDFDRTVNGYLKADPQRVEAIRKELKLEGKTAIGISWKSFNTGYKTKSICLRDMERMFAGLDIVLVNLQYGDVADEIKEFKEEAGIEVLQCASVDNREDLDGLAALIEACDLVVSTSNVTVHMAGALAKKTWVMLNYVPIYYWLLERTDSVWYPTLTLYRQPILDDWGSVFSSIRSDLRRQLTKA